MTTRATVLEAAQRCFYSHGSAPTSIVSVAERSGWSRGAVYHHFDSKQELPKAVIECGKHPLSERLMEMLRKTGPVLPSFKLALCDYLDEIEKNTAIGGEFSIVAWAYDFIEDPASIRDSMMDELTLIHQSILNLMRRAQAQGEIGTTLDCRAFSEIIGSMLLIEVTRSIPLVAQPLKMASSRASLDLIFKLMKQS